MGRDRAGIQTSILARFPLRLFNLTTAGAIQIRIEQPKGGAESSVLIFGPSKDPQLAARGGN
jgi:hypothetical protein